MSGMTNDQALRILRPPRSDLVYERGFVRMLSGRRLSAAQRRELAARRLADGTYPVPLRMDPTIVGGGAIGINWERGE